MIDGHTHKVVATVPAGRAPEGVAVAKDGRRLYIADSGSAHVSVLDTHLQDRRHGARPMTASPSPSLIS
ncbi:hypothetical protein [Streptomyces mirabilis]|uniref:hypothetical protein n=1 Tax=Streptomyces mirabilis TaxID=68239 RepID=UPI0036CCD7E3